MDDQLTTILSLAFHTPIKYKSRIINKSRNMLIDASTTFNFDPSMSFHSTATSDISTFRMLDRTNNSISNAQRSICIAWKSILADYFVNSLNPHWVSSALTPHTTLFMNLKTLETNFLWNFLSTFPSYKWAREPTTIRRGCFFSSFISFSFLYTLSN